MRTQEKFNSIYKSAAWYVEFHDTEIWIVPTETDYRLDKFKPKACSLPEGAAAVFYDVNMHRIGEVRSTKGVLK